MPKLEKLREAKRIWMDFQSIEKELERTKILMIAFDYHNNDKKLAAADQEHTRLNEQLENLNRMRDMLIEELEELNRDFEAAIAEKQKV